MMPPATMLRLALLGNPSNAFAWLCVAMPSPGFAGEPKQCLRQAKHRSKKIATKLRKGYDATMQANEDTQRYARKIAEACVARTQVAKKDLHASLLRVRLLRYGQAKEEASKKHHFKIG